MSHTSKTQRVLSLSTSVSKKHNLCVLFCLSLHPRRVGQVQKSLRTTRGIKTLIENPLSSAKSKHIDVRFHSIRELFKARKISVEYVGSAERHADKLTKALSRANFRYHRKHLMNLTE